jgi:ABC-type polysaccharide/polyol phosphate export permease
MVQGIRHLLIVFSDFILTLIHSRRLILSLTRQDFRSKYLGSYLNFGWAFIQPGVTILILWFVFQVGFKAAPVNEFPFILWLMTGIVPWFFFSEALSNATNSILEYNYLVKKVVFRVSVLHIIKIISSLFVHIFFIIILFLAFFAYGYFPNYYNLQIIYYLFAMVVLILGISWITSALVIFIRDVGQIVAMILQFGFWLTPVIWNLKMVPQKLHPLLMLNPVFYITEGYRNTFVYKTWFWEHPLWTLYFWIFSLGAFIVGGIVFTKLRPHFADVI